MHKLPACRRRSARSYYNGTVRDLNIEIQSFPSSLIAGALHFTPAPFFELDDTAERAAPTISFAPSKP
jgi:LemA protein